MWAGGEMLPTYPDGHLTDDDLAFRLDEIETYANRHSSLSRALAKCGLI